MNIFMHTWTLYLATVLIWGTTWFAIKFQLGVVEPELSLVYRFSIASLVLFLFCLLKNRPLRFSPSEHLYMFLQGLFLYSINYLIFYWATGLLTSGVVALLFSTVVLMNIVNGAVFLGQAIEARTVSGALLGIFGIAAIFWSEIAGMENSQASWQGLWYCLVATFSASLGNILSARNQKNHLPIIQTNAWGMAYGSLVMLAYVYFQGTSFSYDNSVSYTISLLYLSIFGSVFAFGCYLTLIGRIGAAKSSYSAVLFPAVALCISTVFENYAWSLLAIGGCALIVFGNFLVLQNVRRKLPEPTIQKTR